MRLPATLAAHGLVDEHTFVMHPVIAGRGPRLLGGIRDQIQLELVEQRAFRSGVVMQRYLPVT